MSEENRSKDRSNQEPPQTRTEQERAKKKTGVVPPLSSVISEGGPRRVSSDDSASRDKTVPPARTGSPGSGIPPLSSRKRVETNRIPPPPAPSDPRRRIPQAPGGEAESTKPEMPPLQKPAPLRDEISGLSSRMRPGSLNDAPRLADLTHGRPGVPEDIPPVPGMPAAPRLVPPPSESNGEPGAPPSFLKPSKQTARIPHPTPQTAREETAPAEQPEADTEKVEVEMEDGEDAVAAPETGDFPDTAPQTEEEEAEEEAEIGLPPIDEEPEPDQAEQPADGQVVNLRKSPQAPETGEDSGEEEEQAPLAAGETEESPQEVEISEGAPRRPEPLKFDFAKLADQMAARDKATAERAEAQPETEAETDTQTESEQEPAEAEPDEEPPVAEAPQEEDSREKSAAAAVETPAPVSFQSPQVVAADDWSEDKADEAAFHITIPDRESPYHGLQRFEEEDSDQYFGQRQLLADMLDAFDETNLLVLVGPPCAGKSSFLRAGLVPNYREIQKNALSLTFSPGDDPYDSLARAVTRAGIKKNAAAIAREPAHYVFRRLEQKVMSEDEHWLVIIDQFEEFGRCQSEADIPRNAAFVASLVELGQRKNSRIKVVLSLRDDFFWKLGDHRQLASAVDRHLYRLSDLDDKSLRQVITEPLEDNEVDIEEDLVRHLISDVREQAAGLPLMQHVLDLLWLQAAGKSNQMGLDDYLRFGGLEGALRRRLETLYSSFDRAGQEALRRLLLHLIELSVPSSAIRHSFPPIPRPTRLGEILHRDERKILERLIQERIVMCSGQNNVVELPVEAYLQTWPRFRRWLQEVHEVAALRNQLREDARTWSFRIERRGAEAAAVLLWHGAHLSWALELQERGELDELGERLSDVEKRFLAESREQDPPEPVEAQEDDESGEGIPGMTRREVEQALRELEDLRRERVEARERENADASEGMPDLPGDNAQREISDEQDEATADRRRVGGPAVSRRVDDDSLKESIQLNELQHEVIMRERSVKQLKFALIALGVLALLLFVGMISQCRAAAEATADGKSIRPHVQRALVQVSPDHLQPPSAPAATRQ